jgi:hypothetical protein
VLSVASILAIVAFILTWIAAFDCHFFELQIDDDGDGVGLWTLQLTRDGDCKGWNDQPEVKDLLDAPMKFARAMSIIAIMMSPFVVVGILALSRIIIPRTIIKSLAISMFVLSFIVILCLVSRKCFIRAFMLVSMSLELIILISTLALFQVALASDICSDFDDLNDSFDCEIDSSGIACIFAFLLWIGAGCTTLALQTRLEPSTVPAAATPADSGTEEKVEKETKTLGPDGTLTTTHTTSITNPDGSKTVAETTEVTPASS